MVCCWTTCIFDSKLEATCSSWIKLILVWFVLTTCLAGVPDHFSGEGSESRHRFFLNRAKRVIDGRMFGVPLEPAEAE